MKTSLLYITLLAVLLSAACSSTRSMSSALEDDIYYVPNEKPLLVKEVETTTGQPITSGISRPSEDYDRSRGSSVRPGSGNGRVNTEVLTNEAEAILQNNEEVNQTLYESPGYWIGGFQGSESDLAEAYRIINEHPQGFGFVSNGQDIALNLSFSPEWNVYTENGRYWWFPTSSNIALYNTFLFGNYPKQAWTIVWNNPTYDSWAFNSGFNVGLNFGWGSPGWSFGLGWNNGWYNPWYNNWYGYPYWGGWYDPWWGGYPGWHRPHWHYPHWNHPHWGGHYPNWGPPSSTIRPKPGNPRPNMGSGSIGLRPGNPRPGVTNRPNYNSRPVTRPGSSVRPGTSGNQPQINRPNYNTNRPGSMTRPATRPNYNTNRPGVSRPTNSNSRPATTTRPANSNNRYTRPTTRPNTNTYRNNSGSVKSYNRQPNNYRPSYNNNRSSYRTNSSSLNNNRSSYSAPRSNSPSRSGATRTAPSRTTTRSGGRR